MRITRPRPIVFLLLAVGLGPPARADLAPWPLSGGVALSSPSSEATDVVMAEETVSIRVSRVGWRTRASFMLQNTGEAVCLQVGFPAGYEDELQELVALVDGRPVAVEQHAIPRPGAPPASRKVRYWSVWDIPFEVGESHLVDVSYGSTNWLTDLPQPISLSPRRNPWLSCEEEERLEALLERRTLYYTLWTGSLWKGPIGRCRMEVVFEDIPLEHVEESRPPGSVAEEGRLVWDLSPFEPTRDLLVSFYPAMPAADVTPFIEGLQAEHPADPALAIELGGHYQETGQPRKRLTLYHHFVLGWSEPVPELFNRTTFDQAGPFMGVWTMASTAMRVYDHKGLTAEARELAPQMAPMVREYLRQLDAAERDWPSKRIRRRKAKELLALCRKYGG